MIRGFIPWKRLLKFMLPRGVRGKRDPVRGGAHGLHAPVPPKSFHVLPAQAVHSSAPAGWNAPFGHHGLTVAEPVGEGDVERAALALTVARGVTRERVALPEGEARVDAETDAVVDVLSEAEGVVEGLDKQL